MQINPEELWAVITQLEEIFQQLEVQNEDEVKHLQDHLGLQVEDFFIPRECYLSTRMELIRNIQPHLIKFSKN